MAECWVHVPEDRPSFEVVVSKLESVIADCKRLERREYILGVCKCQAAAEFWMEHFFWEVHVPVHMFAVMFVFVPSAEGKWVSELRRHHTTGVLSRILHPPVLTHAPGLGTSQVVH